ncbi:hypothetical protein ACI2KS_12220 [Pseudomonas sp. NPDC087358]
MSDLSMFGEKYSIIGAFRVGKIYQRSYLQGSLITAAKDFS